MTVKGGTSQACAACKYQRRKCSQDCPLAPYFPPDQPKMFQNAHRLFGVSNILKILKQLNTSQKMEAMRSIIYQANIRDRFPVHGCCGIICHLQHQIQQAEQELGAVNAQLAIYRQHHHQIAASSPPHHSPSSQLQLGMPSPNNALPLFQHHPHQPYNSVATGISLAPHHSFSNGGNAAYNTPVYIDPKDNIVNPLWVQHPYNNNNNNNNNPMALQSQLLVSHQIPIHQEATEAPQDYDEIPPFFDTIDDRQSYIDSKEAYDSSSDSSLKDTTQSIEHVSENELKSAAACFSLTSVN
ncbi:PREDICTED: LOB domain-containing protein 27-like isoform X2 [Nelumbo nucifera]|uniref:LOB domain-containing protein n=2 Tax=Nelumbo nucifera TaxID=4432 RepID=A0A822YAK0_NELNU|nr:PREDICTED: LOB domain-containing protein 27-like isoform X2 [Nelumbo nucifera]DAD31124.1 TPA_asm: hypothetical protein HUJ06_009975 [Nelumbo nucifera]